MSDRQTVAPEQFSMRNPRRQTPQDRQYTAGVGDYFEQGLGTTVDKLRNFAKYVPRQTLSSFIAKNEIFKRIVNVHGHIVECGVFLGGGLLTWAQLSAIYEPYNHVRRVIGFDTFTGFPSLDERDYSKDNVEGYTCPGGLATNAYDDIQAGIALYDSNRPIGHIPRVELVRGDASKSIPAYLAEQQHLVVALLYLDFDLYEPTRAALETFLPRMPKGAVLAFDELNQAEWPGETLAAVDTIGLRKLRIERFPFMPQISFAVLD
jgi:hypothetical protein